MCIRKLQMCTEDRAQSVSECLTFAGIKHVRLGCAVVADVPCMKSNIVMGIMVNYDGHTIVPSAYDVNELVGN